MNKRTIIFLFFCILVSPFAIAKGNILKLSNGIIATVPQGKIKIQVCNENIIRVIVSPVDTFSKRSSLIISNSNSSTNFEIVEKDHIVKLSTGKLIVKLNLLNGSINFLDKSGNVILKEREKDGRRILPINVCGEDTWSIRQQWESPKDEVIHGLGHHQNDLFNMRGANIDLWQENCEIAIPFFVSNKGYGILWDNYSHSKFGFPVTPNFIPCNLLYDKYGKQGALTGSYYNGNQFNSFITERSDSIINFDFKTFGPQKDNSFSTDPNWISKPLDKRISKNNYTVRWEGKIKSMHAGEYIFNTFTTHNIRLWIDNQLIVNGYGSSDLYLKGKINLKANTLYNIKYEWQKDSLDPIHNFQNGAVQLRWTIPSIDKYDGITLNSEVSDGIDYYFIYGPQTDQIISSYRQLTGAANMLPAWAYGYWHSHLNINSQKEYLNLIDEFRKRNIPLDVLVQDLGYWEPNYAWGSHQFNENRYPDPTEMIRNAHKNNVKYIISVWGMFQRNSKNWEELNRKGLLFGYNNCSFWTDKGTWYYNPFSKEGRDIYWQQMKRDLFAKGVDGWWLDASEPEISTPADPFLYKKVMNNNLGTGARYLNAYSLMQTKGIYEGQRACTESQRVVTLTRSAFAGQQSNSTIMWTGDIAGTWDVFRKQVKCGLNFALTGLPYWTTDIGGFFINTTDWPNTVKEERYRELYTRWFQWGTFCPIMRTHGCGSRREMWTMGEESYKIQKKFDEIRHQLFPYIYSNAYKVYKEGYTLMRPLLMDFALDKQTHSIYDQFMFGPSFMICPVLEPKISHRKVYLPKGHIWYNYWNNKLSNGGQTVVCPTPLHSIPIWIKGGSIIPSIKTEQYIGETRHDSYTISVYTGADGKFILYNDEKDGYNYEKGINTLIPISWNESKKCLILDNRKGNYKDMNKIITFKLRFISKNGVIEKDISYNGERIILPIIQNVIKTYNYGK